MNRLLKTKKEYKKIKETGDSRYFYFNELDKVWFQQDKAYGDFKNLLRKTASDKILRDKAFDVVKNLKHDTYQRGFASIVYNLFYKESSDGATKSKIFLN